MGLGDNFSIKMETIKKKEMKNSFSGLNADWTKAEQRISELEDGQLKLSQLKRKEKEVFFRREQSVEQ